MEFTKKELEIVKQAVDEYEEKHWESEDNNWQKIINKLMEKLG